MYKLTLVFGFAATLLFLVVRVRKAGIPGLIAKSIASFFFLATACAALAANVQQHFFGILIILGLLCGLLGDLWLDLKWIYPADNDTYLYAGFYSFLVGHLFYVTAIFLHYEWSPVTLALSVGLALAGAALSIALEKVMGLDYGKCRLTCLVYGFMLMLTTSSSIIAASATGETVWMVMSAGSVLFLASDLVLSGTYFGTGKNTPALVVLNHALYYSAQYVIASSILFLVW